MDNSSINLGKYISFLLRHHPETIGLTLDREGYADIDELTSKSAAAGRVFSKETLLEIVENNDKHR
jgi:putative RNA 2'-phosphotransferase